MYIFKPNIIDGQGEYCQECDTKLPGMCLCDSQYYDGQNTNTNRCCTKQSAHSCQVSNSSLDIQRSVPSVSGNFLRSSANLGKSCSLCIESYMHYTNVNSLTTCYSNGSSYIYI